MKKLVIFGFLVLVGLWSKQLFSNSAYGQEFDAPKAFQDYQYIHTQYHLAHRDYLNARSAYFNYRTLTAKEEAKDKTLKMLQLRDEVVRTYLTALKIRLLEAEGISEFERNELVTLLDNEITWHLDHRENLTSAGSLEDLVDLSEDAADQWQTSLAIVYKSLTAILAGKEEVLRNDIDRQVVRVENKLSEVRLNGDKNTASLERWLLEAKNRLETSHRKQDEAKMIVNQLKAKDYNQARYLIQESNQYLKETNSYLKEIVREVKIAD